GIPGPVPLAAPFGRLLGQPLRPASRNLGLLPTDALRPPRDDQGRPAILSRRRAHFGRHCASPILRGHCSLSTASYAAPGLWVTSPSSSTVTRRDRPLNRNGR